MKNDVIEIDNFLKSKAFLNSIWVKPSYSSWNENMSQIVSYQFKFSIKMHKIKISMDLIYDICGYILFPKTNKGVNG